LKDVVGLIHAWDINFFEKVCSSFGRLGHLDKATAEKQRLDVIRCFVSRRTCFSDVFSRILNIKVDDEIFPYSSFERSNQELVMTSSSLEDMGLVHNKKDEEVVPCSLI